nr:MAG TPA: hypothetical protein [Crassvirales sp.]
MNYCHHYTYYLGLYLLTSLISILCKALIL